MTKRRLKLGAVLATAIFLLAGSPAQAQLFGRRTPAPPPNVADLVRTLREDGDENKRIDAAEALRNVDPKQHPEIIPALTQALLQDQRPSVRVEAASTLGRFRPVQPQIGMALEQARDNDGSMRVRLQARGTLLSYYFAGYRSPRGDEARQMLQPNGPTTKEPPLATGMAPGTATANPPTPGPFLPAPVIDTTGGAQAGTISPYVPATTPPVVVETPSQQGFQPLPKGPPSQGPSLGSPPG